MLGFVLDKQDYENHCTKGKWKLIKGSLVIAKWETCCTMYKRPKQMFGMMSSMQ